MRRRLGLVLAVHVGPFALAIGACTCGDGDGLGRVVPQIEVTPDALSFGDVPYGATKRLRVTVRNTGSADLEITGADAMAPFGAIGAPQTVRTGAETTIDVSFTPANDEPQSGLLIIASNDPEHPMVSVILDGRGVQGLITVRPTMVDFSNTSVGTTRSAEIFFSNLGIEDVEASLVTEGFPRPEHFTLTGIPRFDQGGPLGLPARAEVELGLSYLPIDLGEDGGRLVLEICGDRCGVEVAVVASASLAVIRLEPPLIDFGTVGIGSTKSETVLVVNSGQTPVEVTSVTTAGGAELHAVPARGLPARVDGNSSVAISVEFTPTSAAQFSGELIVRTNDSVVPEARVRVSGKGEGPLFIVQPETIGFGAQRQPATYQRSLLLLNAGSADVRVESMSVSGDAFGLDDVPGLPARLGSGQSLVPHVTFSPATVGEYLGELTIETNDPAQPVVTVPLSGGLADRLCELQMTPDRVNFGLMPLGYSRTKSVEIRNVGTDTCELQSGMFRAPIDPAIAPVAATFPAFPTTLMPGQSLSLDFSYTPSALAESKANFVLLTGDPVFPERHLVLLGSSEGYVDLFTRPEFLDFGSIMPLCSGGRREVRIYNAGTTNADVTGITMSSTPEILLSAPAVPFVLEAGSTEAFYVEYLPADLGVDTAVVEVEVRDLPYPLVVPIAGEGTTNPRARDQFAQEENQKVDVLFVIDDSCSMSDEQAALAQNFRTFISQANVRSVDFRIGITTTTIFPTPGALVGPVMSNSTQNLDAVFQAQASVGIGGSGIEQGLDAMAGALQLADQGVGLNRELRRQDATLMAIIISDEDDQSSAATVYFLNVLRNLTAAGYIAAVVTGGPSGCVSGSGPGSGAAPAPRYQDFIALTGGISESICGNWASTLGNLGNAAFGLKTVFVLTNEADTMQPIDVRIDGNVVPAGSWSYDPADHSIRFMTPPPEGSTVSVEYTPSC